MREDVTHPPFRNPTWHDGKQPRRSAETGTEAEAVHLMLCLLGMCKPGCRRDWQQLALSAPITPSPSLLVQYFTAVSAPRTI
jgi:hypothetical protein